MNNENILRKNVNELTDEQVEFYQRIMMSEQVTRMADKLDKIAIEQEAQNERFRSVSEDVKELKDTMRINGTQEFQIKNKANKKVVKVLGGKESPAYKKMSRKVFSRFWVAFNRHFTIPRYGELPKKKFNEALVFIDRWQPDTSTGMEIESLNNQQSFNFNK